MTQETNGKLSVINSMAEKFGMEGPAFETTLRATVFPAKGTREEFAAFLLVCKNYSLNPITKEIYAFPKQGGGIVPVVSIDGWMNMINSHPAFDGMSFAEQHDQHGELVSTECTIYRKDRAYPISVTEYFAECRRPTEPWKMKHRMLRHKAVIQCSRYAFGFAGIYDEDEGMKIAMSEMSRQVRVPPPPPKMIAQKLDHIAEQRWPEDGPKIVDVTADPETGEINQEEESVAPKLESEVPWEDPLAVPPRDRKTADLLLDARIVASRGAVEFTKWMAALSTGDYHRLAPHTTELIAASKAAGDSSTVVLSEAAKKAAKLG